MPNVSRFMPRAAFSIIGAALKSPSRASNIYLINEVFILFYFILFICFDFFRVSIIGK